MKALPSDHKNLFELNKKPVWKIKIQKLVTRLIKNDSGVGAVEFALLVPVLLGLYVGAVELSVALSIDKKVSKASAITTDIISQKEDINKTFLTEMTGVAKSIIAPYNSSSLGMQVIGINIDNSGTPTIAWSWNEANERPFTGGNEIIIPNAYKIPNTFLLKTTLDLDHDLLLLSPKNGKITRNESLITLQKEYYLHQREAKAIACSNC